MLTTLCALGLIGSLYLAWRLDPKLALRLLIFAVVLMIVAGTMLAGVDTRPIRNWWVPVI